jgi:Predicted dehydrogenases and related proteins
MKDSIVRVGIIGCGRIAQTRHIPEYANNPNVQLSGFYNRTYSLAQALANQYSAKAYATAEELLADPFIDAVSILTPNNTHTELTLAALRAGKHVLCEKPMAVSLEECNLLMAAESASSKKLMIAQNQRFYHAHIQAKRMIESGEIGEILTFQTNFLHGGPSIDSESWFLNPALGSFGVLGDLGIHKIDLIHYLTGQQIVSASAVLGALDKKQPNGAKIALEDNAVCLFKLGGGAFGTMAVSWTAYGKPDIATRIYGTKGTIELYRELDAPFTRYRIDGSAENIHFERQQNSGVIDAFVNCIVSNSPSPVSASSVVPAMKVIFAAYESNQANSAMVTIEPN